MTCDCCGHYDPSADLCDAATAITVFALSPICDDCLRFWAESGLRLGDVADFLQLCHSIDTGTLDQ